MTRRWLSAAPGIALLMAAAGAAMPAERTGYLAPGAFDILAVLPPAPVPGDPRYDADRRVFRHTRHLLGTPRGAMATSDVQRAPAAMLQDYGCALDASLTPDKLPLTVALIERASRDTNAQKDRAKDFYKRRRPFLIDSGPVCQPKPKLATTYDYPSGHTTGGWTWALILADLAPDRAAAILARGRAFGQSRAVCGAHNASAVEAGWMTADATMAAVRTTPAFHADLAAARAEFAAARAAAPTPDAARCTAERALVGQRIY
jgi:acid phosphatase (class A)